MNTQLTDLVVARLPVERFSTTLLAIGWTEAEVDVFRASGLHVTVEPEDGITYDFAAVVLSEDTEEFDAENSVADSDVSSPKSGIARLMEVLRDSVAREGKIWLLVKESGASKLPQSGDRATRRLVMAASESGLSVTGDEILTGDGGRVFDCRPDNTRIRTYRDGDETKILDLFAECFHQSRTLEHWRWKYARNPWSNYRMSLAWDDEDELLAHYAGFGLPLWDHGHESLALQMGDTMTDPRARALGTRRGSVLARTVRHFFAAFREPEIDLFFGFNTGPIQRFCRWFIGGGQVDVVNYWHAEQRPPGPRQRGYRVVAEPILDASFDRLFARAAEHYGFLVRRDAGFLEWRYRRCPDVDYRIFAATRFGRLVGWSIFRRIENRVVWGDALFLRRHAAAAARAILDAALDSFECTSTEAWFSPHPSWWTALLAPLGFGQVPEPQGLAMMALDNTRELDLARFYYTKGDGDLF